MQRDSVPAVPVIRRLDKEVVNRIAAGEVIHRPSSALKELIENSLDARSTTVSVVLKDGGLKFLQVTDNGCGIRVEDFPILCERFTTSKITKYEDLSKIGTFGFRGEALASVSHVAHVTITSMTASAACAYRARFSDGKLVDETSGKPAPDAKPKPCAGVKGTQITVEDLFFNVPVRQQALRAPSEEYSRCLDVVTKYAVHFAGVAFSCKKAGAARADVNTSAGATRLDVVRSLYGQEVVREVVPVEYSAPAYELQIHGLVTNANYHVKKLEFILFINNRLVESSTLRKAVETVYAQLLPRNTHPWVYIALSMAPHNLDVNVHPTKKEVRFLYEEQVSEAVQAALLSALSSANSSRSFPTHVITSLQAPRDSGTVGTTVTRAVMDTPSTNAFDTGAATSSSVTKAGLSSIARTSTDSIPEPMIRDNRRDRSLSANQLRMDTFVQRSSSDAPLRTVSKTISAKKRAAAGSPDGAASTGKRIRKGVYDEPLQLLSVQELIAEIDDSAHTGLKSVFQQHVFVSCVNATYSLLQHKTKLYIVHTPSVSNSFFYEQVIRQFGKVRPRLIESPLPVGALVYLSLEASSEPSITVEDRIKMSKTFDDLLLAKAPMLKEYFSIIFDAGPAYVLGSGADETEPTYGHGYLSALPDLLHGYMPPLIALPTFLLRLASEVDWRTEKPCFRSVAQELARFFMVQPQMYLSEADCQRGSPLPPQQLSRDTNDSSSSSAPRHEGVQNSVFGTLFQSESVLYPALRTNFTPQRKHATDLSVLEIASLENLYKIFERC